MSDKDITDILPSRKILRNVRNGISTITPAFIRKNLTGKLLTILLLGTLVSGLSVFVLYGQIDDGLTKQVDSQVESDTTLYAELYDDWLQEHWSTMSTKSSDGGLLTSDRQELNSWLDELTRDLSEEVDSTYVVDKESGEIIGSSVRRNYGINLYEHGLSKEAVRSGIFISEPIMLPNKDEKITFLGYEGLRNKFVIAGVPTNTTLVPSQTFNGSTTVLRTVDGQRILGPSSDGSQEAVADFEPDTSITQMTHGGGKIRGTRTLSHSATGGFSQQEYIPEQTLGTVVVHSVPEDKALALGEDISNDILLAFGLTFVLLIGTALVSMRSVTTAIDDLSGRTQQISEGDFDVDVSSGRDDEIGVLYRSVGAMRDALSERIEEAQAAIEETETAREDAEQAQNEAEQARREAEAVSKQLEKQAEEYSDVLAEFADGNLTVRMDTETDNAALARIATSFNEMAGDLEETIVHIREFAADVSESSDQISASAGEIKQTSDDVSRSMQETAEDADRQDEDIQRASQRVIDQSASIEEVAASTDEATTQSQRAAKLSADGQEYADNTTSEMATIEQRTEEMVREVENLDDEVGAIGDIVELIEEIAEQTNMLALNASIEAARAGEAGEGFAVVANEIKSLSEETQAATDEIEQLVTHAQDSTEDVVTDIQGMRESVETGTETVEQTVDVFEEIATAVEEVDRTIQSISGAVDNQADAAEEIEALVQDIGDVSEATTANATDVAAAVEEQTSAVSEVNSQIQGLSDRAATLQEITDEFVVESEDRQADDLSPTER
ncbi:methyl-accepting chemotaxis protein [Halovenus rubra]|uniref:Methyl-accepting chemotaxis protein n=2 Tax=Halovenus rubra TaxID=869890 RepID=A0ACC7DZB6_9EURY|nr:methyl-accepting chemotaxis protein [Halovenus rubra]